MICSEKKYSLNENFKDFQLLLPSMWKNNIACVFGLTYLTKATVYSSNPSLQTTPVHISNWIFAIAWNSYQIIWWKWVTNTTKRIVIFRWKRRYRQRCWHFFVALAVLFIIFFTKYFDVIFFPNDTYTFQIFLFPMVAMTKK